MEVSEAIEKATHGLGVEASVRGRLIVSDAVAYLIPREESEAKAILVLRPGLADALTESGIPVLVGSMVLFSGPAEIEGMLNKTGMALLPAALYSIKSLKFWHEDRQYNLEPRKT